ncbi:hypothetical protein X896_2783 [Burkholderia pseudomallei ABCPW 1]|nr:hypothetical protein X896_2783 [Burkholderia pseudomallei ABCPW 1]
MLRLGSQIASSGEVSKNMLSSAQRKARVLGHSPHRHWLKASRRGNETLKTSQVHVCDQELQNRDVRAPPLGALATRAAPISQSAKPLAAQPVMIGATLNGRRKNRRQSPALTCLEKCCRTGIDETAELLIARARRWHLGGPRRVRAVGIGSARLDRHTQSVGPFGLSEAGASGPDGWPGVRGTTASWASPCGRPTGDRRLATSSARRTFMTSFSAGSENST